MRDIKFILFDCMETLIDMSELPKSNDYALWAYNNSGVEEYWKGFDEFLVHYEQAKKNISIGLSEHKEYEITQRFLVTTHLNRSIKNEEERNRIVTGLYNNYWKTYVEKCYVNNDVKEVIKLLSEKYKMGVVSNFKVKNGIEKLLELHDLSQHFNFILTSINEGWRKPHPNIYRNAITKAGCKANDILFFGDDLENDYLVPKKIGLKSILLDRYDKFESINDRVSSFYDFLAILNAQ